jgi:hypothetical protein
MMGVHIMNKKRCLNCGRRFYPYKHIKNQRYCSNKECQSIRVKNWIKYKLKHNKNYRAYRKIIQDKWKANNPNYWLRYKELAEKIKTLKGESEKTKSKKPILKILIKRDTLATLPKMGIINCNCKLVLSS